ncbi:TIGR02466 family protein [Rhodoplanes roseus]|uniref:JmjC domain-containing protein n=1 Tax=Rhodoplanes roseus TaxID=29409 RepID=A0A327KZA3_9BRAD|nr:TIGR02466 family protein [Rhodoplanes roseus]RAI43571.1 hypothetical protein CH341_13540 [Rhodoplanes roseus]
MSQVIGLFPTPVMRVEKLLSSELIATVTAEIQTSQKIANAYSDRLSHTPVAGVETSDVFATLGQLALPKVVEFGEILFGETLQWQIKEIWVNVLEPGGRQAIHTHANSFISGVFYLTRPHASANIVFHRSLGGNSFIFSNHHPNARINQFNGGKWAMPDTTPGDLVMFPSYLLHEVPTNHGEQRISIAFNAIPDRLDNFGYAIRFS